MSREIGRILEAESGGRSLGRLGRCAAGLRNQLMSRGVYPYLLLEAESSGRPLGRLGCGAAGLRNELAVPLPFSRLLPLRFHLLQPLSGLLHLSLKQKHDSKNVQLQR